MNIKINSSLRFGATAQTCGGLNLRQTLRLKTNFTARAAQDKTYPGRYSNKEPVACHQAARPFIGCANQDQANHVLQNHDSILSFQPVPPLFGLILRVAAAAFVGFSQTERTASRFVGSD